MSDMIIPRERLHRRDEKSWNRCLSRTHWHTLDEIVHVPRSRFLFLVTSFVRFLFRDLEEKKETRWWRKGKRSLGWLEKFRKSRVDFWSVSESNRAFHPRKENPTTATGHTCQPRGKKDEGKRRRMKKKSTRWRAREACKPSGGMRRGFSWVREKARGR